MVCDFIMQKYTIISHTSITEIRSFFYRFNAPAHIIVVYCTSITLKRFNSKLPL